MLVLINALELNVQKERFAFKGSAETRIAKKLTAQKAHFVQKGNVNQI